MFPSDPPNNGVQIGGSNLVADQIKASNNAAVGLGIASVTNSLIKEVVADSNGFDGIQLTNFGGPNATGNTLLQINSMNNQHAGLFYSNATSNFLIQYTGASCGQDALDVANGTLTGNTFSEITVAK